MLPPILGVFKTCADLECGKARALWVATKCLRQLFGEIDEGVPQVSLIRPWPLGQGYTQVEFVFRFGDREYVLAVRVRAGDLRPNQGTVHLTRTNDGVGVLQCRFVLEGEPDHPVLTFILGGDGPA